MKRMEMHGIEAMPRINILLTPSRSKALRFTREYGIEDAGLKHGDAQTVALINGSGLRIMVLVECDGATRTQEHALLAHEAVHVARYYFEHIGEDDPSSEFAAYVVQAVTQHLIKCHEKWKRRK